jgi:hypothetical protein
MTAVGACQPRSLRARPTSVWLPACKPILDSRTAPFVVLHVATATIPRAGGDAVETQRRSLMAESDSLLDDVERLRLDDHVEVPDELREAIRSLQIRLGRSDQPVAPATLHAAVLQMTPGSSLSSAPLSARSTGGATRSSTRSARRKSGSNRMLLSPWPVRRGRTTGSFTSRPRRSWPVRVS